jgi:hypothetical protein
MGASKAREDESNRAFVDFLIFGLVRKLGTLGVECSFWPFVTHLGTRGHCQLIKGQWFLVAMLLFRWS